jgi:hypothetical protein
MVRRSRTEQRERSGEGPGIRAREGVRRREQGRDGQAPGDGRVRAIGVLHDRGARRPQAQRSVCDTGSKAVPSTQSRWPGCHGSTQGCPGRAQRARPWPAGRHPQGPVTRAGRGGTSGPSGSGQWCYIRQRYRRGARFPGSRTGRSRGRRAAAGRSGTSRTSGPRAPGSVLAAPGTARAPVPAGHGSARPAARTGTGRRSWSQAGPPWCAAPGPAAR